MEELRIFLNALSQEQQREFAVKCATSIGYLRKAISKNQELGAALCVLIESASQGVVSRKNLHPTDWQKIWPELARADAVHRKTANAA
ncbi:MAG: Cro/Cl family transcriptional regulator [Ewingella americana]|uniref:Cro/Cl family transcriptional regulator n=1 Tax=Ewingella TaxID=41201 RepID=UPI00242E5D88|nr:Cro/Cl family transcriptional regulator [Ewingella americana]MCI1676607.1 Cro/Cl family transcriptional regulator [Ewingella americana]MCI1853803.1 Cro/Cl family transcriptional regulator [Ewingella americana]MCI1859956.1 Cro/Cl family transcriptional regulator [Ewingella americana]MCI2142284.1 Cro/Cl family transcriptional regulator [Ewingella americana]MCI2163247.1 Cro/Cl family transcriptional regulator [Ewingella americana]